MKIIKRKLIWANISVRKRVLYPTYYFDYDLLNEIGFPDEQMIFLLDEMKEHAEKELKDRKEKKQNYKQ